jgi:hypothetical protein
VAAPGHRLCAHDRRRFFSGQFDQCLQRFVELIGLHVVGVAAK